MTGPSLPGHIGRYRILRTLGEGGMGVVYEAEQTEPVKRVVAVKVLKSGLDSSQVIARFEAERQALAVMDHPGTARVLDAGISELGQPFFVMELVRGETLTDFCDERRLPLRARVELFVQVCEAVQHAHQKGVLHRDLKPANVLVSDDGSGPRAKVIDFGIAKAVEGSLTDTDAKTVAGMVVGTPAYLSPEQAGMADADVDTRADVYSLGVTLYQLLAGVLPFRRDAYEGVKALVAAGISEPPRPSRRLGEVPDELARLALLRGTDPPGLRRTLSGDLDWIVMKALEKDRARRYQTALALADDLRRYLAHEVVEARAPTPGYRFRRFAQRNRVAVALAGALGVVLVGFTGAQAVQMRIVAAARDDADLRRGQAEGLIDFMLGDLRSSLTPIGRLDIMNNLADQALAYFAAMPESELSDEDLYRRTQALRQIGEVRLTQGDLPGADESFQEALPLSRELAARDSLNGDWQLGLAFSHFWIGNVLRIRGELRPALDHFVAYRDIASALVARAPDHVEYRTELAYSHNNIGILLQALGDRNGAAESLDRALEIKAALLEEDPENDNRVFDVASAHNTLGVINDELGRYQVSVEHFRRNVTLLERLVASDTTNWAWQNSLARARNFYASELEVVGDVDGALSQLRMEVALEARLVSHDPTNAEWRRNRAIGFMRLGRQQRFRGEGAAALGSYRSAEAILRELLTVDRPRAIWNDDLSFALVGVAAAALDVGDVRLAEGTIRRASAAIDPGRVEADQQARVAAGAVALMEGKVWSALGDSERAASALTRAVELVTPVVEDSDDRTALVVWAEASHRLGRGGEALRRLDDLGFRDPNFWQSVGRALP